jgi:hypothetical protein
MIIKNWTNFIFINCQYKERAKVYKCGREPVYPSLRQINELGLKPQNKQWEELGIE